MLPRVSKGKNFGRGALWAETAFAPHAKDGNRTASGFPEGGRLPDVKTRRISQMAILRFRHGVGPRAGMGAKNAEPLFETQADSTSSKFFGWQKGLELLIS